MLSDSKSSVAAAIEALKSAASAVREHADQIRRVMEVLIKTVVVIVINRNVLIIIYLESRQ